MCCKRYHFIFSTFSSNFKCKNLCSDNHILDTWLACVQPPLPSKKSIFLREGAAVHRLHVTSYELTHFKKMMRVWKTKSLLICLRYDPLIVFRRQNHVTFIFIKTMSHDLLVQLAYLQNFRLNRYHFRSDQKLNNSRISRNFPRKFPCHSPPFSES